MKTTVTQAVTDRAPTQETLLPVVQREVMPLLREMRRVNNYAYQVVGTASNTDAGTKLWRSDAVPTSATVVVEALVSAPGRALRLVGVFQDAAGVLAQVDSTVEPYAIPSTTSGLWGFEVDATNRQVTIVQDSEGDKGPTKAWVTAYWSDEL